MKFDHASCNRSSRFPLYLRFRPPRSRGDAQILVPQDAKTRYAYSCPFPSLGQLAKLQRFSVPGSGTFATLTSDLSTAVLMLTIGHGTPYAGNPSHGHNQIP